MAHAIEFGLHEHEHDGVTCVALLNDDSDPVAIVDQLTAFDGYFPAGTAVPVQTNPVLFGVRRAIRPPATGPPLT